MLVVLLLAVAAKGGVIWRLGKVDGRWTEFGEVAARSYKVPSNWKRWGWSSFPSRLKDGCPLTIEWEQEEARRAVLRFRLLDLSCDSPVKVEVKLNGRLIHSHLYEPARVWLHQRFSVSVRAYIPLQWQRTGENSITLSVEGGSGRIDFVELREFSLDSSPEMWLFAGIGRPEYVASLAEGRLPLEWVDFNARDASWAQCERRKGERRYPPPDAPWGERWAAWGWSRKELEELYGGIRLRPMSTPVYIPDWASLKKAVHPDWRKGCGKVTHLVGFGVGGELKDYDAWEEFVAWHVRNTADWVYLYRNLGEWDNHWFGNGGSWEGFLQYIFRYARAVKENDPRSFVIVAGNHTHDTVGWDAEAHGLPQDAWSYYERLVYDKWALRYADALGYHCYEYANSNVNAPWVAAEHLRALLDRAGLHRLEVAIDEWGHDRGFPFVRQALPRLIHAGTVNKLMCDWSIVSYWGDARFAPWKGWGACLDDRYGLVYPSGEIKDAEVFECWRAWSELFHGARRVWVAVSPVEGDAGRLFYGASASRRLITDLLTGRTVPVENVTLVFDNFGEDVAVEVAVPLPSKWSECHAYLLRPEVEHLEFVGNLKAEAHDGEARFTVKIPGNSLRVVKLTERRVDPRVLCGKRDRPRGEGEPVGIFVRADMEALRVAVRNRWLRPISGVVTVEGLERGKMSRGFEGLAPGRERGVSFPLADGEWRRLWGRLVTVRVRCEGKVVERRVKVFLDCFEGTRPRAWDIHPEAGGRIGARRGEVISGVRSLVGDTVSKPVRGIGGVWHEFAHSRPEVLPFENGKEHMIAFKFKVLRRPTPGGYPGRGGCFYAKGRTTTRPRIDNIGGVIWGGEGQAIRGEGLIRTRFLLRTGQPCLWLFGVRLRGAVAIDDFSLAIVEGP